jgi:hypothetical protein
MSQQQKIKNPQKAEYRSIIGKDSFSVCLPKRYGQELGLEQGDYVRVTQEADKIIIEKAE